MKRLSALALALVFLVAHGVAGATAVSAQPVPATPKHLRLNVTELTPRVVTPKARKITVRATATNVGDREITDIVARLQFGGRLSSEEDLAQTLAEPPPSDAASSDWVEVPKALSPGESARLTISVPVGELPLTSPGVYPMLVNVNGTPAYGGPARLADVDLLMPVIEPPAEVEPTGVSMLWPIAASHPRVVGRPFRGPVVLSDDGLADELKPGGRLDALVSAAAARRDNPAVFGSLCFAIDPDLVETVATMTRGYRVQTPSGTVPGKARADAARWLDSLRALVAGHCVVQIPFGGADLTALPKVDTPVDLMGIAVDGSAIRRVLGVESQPGVLWPEGALDKASAKAAAGVGVRTLITNPAQSEFTGGGALRTLTYDPLVARGFAGTQDPHSVARQPNVATQNGMAAIAFRSGLGDEASSGPILVAPPHGWSTTVTELVSFLDSLSAFHAAGMLRPAPLGDLLADDAPPSDDSIDGEDASDDLDVRESAGAATAPSGELLKTLSDVETTAEDLRRAMSVDATRQVQPGALIDPLHEAVLRATSTSWHTRANRMAAAEAASDQLGALLGGVTVETPPQPVSLASGSSPLPVTVRNSLPVKVTFRVRLDNAAGLRPAHISPASLGAGTTRGVFIPAEALRSGRFNVDVSLETPGGTKLGQTARLELTSSEFGVVMVVVTATAGALLVLLAARRIYRRIRDARRPTSDTA